MNRKPIVISMGEPAGINTEILVKTWISRKKNKIFPFFVIDNYFKVRSIINYFNLKAKIKTINNPSETFEIFNEYLPIYNIGNEIKYKLGLPEKKNSKFIIESLRKSFDFVKNGHASGIITLPICKKTMKQYGFNFNGQTEYIGHLSKKYIDPLSNEIMILTTSKPLDKGKNLIIGLVTTHIPFKKVVSQLSKKKLKEKIVIFHNSLKSIWKIKNPLIGVLGINPHAGEYGIIGEEENKIVSPVIKSLNRNKLRLEGPLSSDSCFFKNNRKKYDGILCLYHDQGLSPLKTLDFFNSVNVTGGLPILRVSPDHGPAFDIAKKNSAKIDSLISCFEFLEKYS